MTSSLGRRGGRIEPIPTSAKVQKNIFRTKLGGISEVVGSRPPLTDKFLTNETNAPVGALGRFKKV